MAVIEGEEPTFGEGKQVPTPPAVVSQWTQPDAPYVYPTAIGNQVASGYDQGEALNTYLREDGIVEVTTGYYQTDGTYRTAVDFYYQMNNGLLVSAQDYSVALGTPGGVAELNQNTAGQITKAQAPFWSLITGDAEVWMDERGLVRGDVYAAALDEAWDNMMNIGMTTQQAHQQLNNLIGAFSDVSRVSFGFELNPLGFFRTDRFDDDPNADPEYLRELGAWWMPGGVAGQTDGFITYLNGDATGSEGNPRPRVPSGPSRAPYVKPDRRVVEDWVRGHLKLVVGAANEPRVQILTDDFMRDHFADYKQPAQEIDPFQTVKTNTRQLSDYKSIHKLRPSDVDEETYLQSAIGGARQQGVDTADAVQRGQEAAVGGNINVDQTVFKANRKTTGGFFDRIQTATDVLGRAIR